MRADPDAGSVVRLRDVARIELGALQYASTAFFGEDPTVVLGDLSRCRARTRSTCSSASRTRWRSCRSASRRASTTPCTTTRRASCRRRCTTCVITLVEALLLVVAVVFIFLQSWRTTIIPTIAIPVSLIATLVVMQLLGFSLNMLSLLGMVLAIGLVVDDAIVVVENVERQLEAGLQPLEAARAAMKEVTGPIIATTAVLMAVFVPVAFIPGVAGRLYNQFALTVAISVGISAFNSLTLSPALSAAFLRHRGDVQFRAVPLVQQRLRLAVARLCRQRARADPPGAGRCWRCSWRRSARPICVSTAHSLDLPAGRGSGLFLRRHPVAGRRVAGAHRRGGQAGARHPARRRPASISSARSAASTS